VVNGEALCGRSGQIQLVRTLRWDTWSAAEAGDAYGIAGDDLRAHRWGRSCCAYCDTDQAGTTSPLTEKPGYERDIDMAGLTL
jgi:hypothetical protein